MLLLYYYYYWVSQAVANLTVNVHLIFILTILTGQAKNLHLPCQQPTRTIQSFTEKAKLQTHYKPRFLLPQQMQQPGRASCLVQVALLLPLVEVVQVASLVLAVLVASLVE